MEVVSLQTNGFELLLENKLIDKLLAISFFINNLFKVLMINFPFDLSIQR
jgi:hypothetical protein